MSGAVYVSNAAGAPNGDVFLSLCVEASLCGRKDDMASDVPITSYESLKIETVSVASEKQEV